MDSDGNHPIRSTADDNGHREFTGLLLPMVVELHSTAKIQSLHISPENLPSPFNCTASVPLSPTLSMMYAQFLAITLTS